jgi:autotransporter-associated beta strand protein
MSGPGGLTKSGLGFLVEQMFAANTFAGATVVTAGSVLLDSVGGVAVPGALMIEPSTGSGTVTVGCGRDNRTADTSTLTVARSGVLDLMNHAITFAAVEMDGGTITTGARGELDLGGDVTAGAATSSTIDGFVSLGTATPTFNIGAGSVLTVQAAIDGGGGLVKAGAGELVLSGDDALTGPATIEGGTLTADGTIAGSVVVEPGGSLDGEGSVGALLAQAGTVRANAGSGSLTVRGELVLGPGSTLSVVVNGSANVGHSNPLVAGGAVQINGATLSVAVESEMNPGEALKLIENRGTVITIGSFSGLPNGAVFTAGGETFRINYGDGGGRDVTLTDLADSQVTLAVKAPAGRLTHGGRTVLQATVAAGQPGAPAPTGIITFFDGSMVLGSAPLIGGKASLTTTRGLGDQLLTATYEGDANFGTTSSPVIIDRIGTRALRAIERTYDTAVGHPARPAALAFWLGLLRRGMPLARIKHTLERRYDFRMRRSGSQDLR